jgi:LmbE family N-acetylglucosaminyl deacetylase
MSLPSRVLGRVRRAIDLLRDMPRRHALASRARPARTFAPIADLARHSALVIVAHPDDEAIAAGALLAQLPRAGVICFTDGAPRHGSSARQAGFDNWMDYAAVRRREAEAVIARIGRPLSPVENLGIADQDAVHHLEAATRYLVKPLQTGFDYVITHPYEGGHPDHDAVAFAVHAAAALIAQAGGRPPVILEAAFYNSAHGRADVGAFVPHSDAGDILVMPLRSEERALKRALYDCHLTQRAILADFTTEWESFRVAPRYHFAAPPHAGEIGYRRFSWAMPDRNWRALAWEAMRKLGLEQELA